MRDRAAHRLADIIDAIQQINALLGGKTIADIWGDRPLKAAYERFLEILSEASRHIPNGLKESEPAIEWRRVADIGNHIRHAYHSVDVEILWALHEQGKLSELHAAAKRMEQRLLAGRP